jgi:thiamine transport system substrate-binding protein
VKAATLANFLQSCAEAAFLENKMTKTYQNKISKSLSLASVALAVFTLPALSAETKTLTIYTYESFTAEWGPGLAIEKSFEASCACDLKFVSVADGVALLNRVKIEGTKTEADIVLGLDTNLTSEAAATGLFVPHGMDGALAKNVPGGWTDANFLPYDFGWFAVVYDTETLKTPPKSLAELVDGNPEDKIVIQDPRTSTPGLGLLLWVKQIYGDKAPEAWAKLSKRVLTVTPGWSEAYSLFTSGEAPMVLSYTTSPAYHMIAESKNRYQAAAFNEGHYLQIEVAGMTMKGAANPLAKQFMAFMLSPGFQNEVPEKNWMMPVADTSTPLNPVFGQMVQPVKSLIFTPEEVAKNRDVWVKEWLGAFGK